MAFPGLQHVAITVSDLDASTQWYTRLFGADPVLDEDEEGGEFHHVVYALDGGLLFGLHTHMGQEAKDRADERRTGLDHISFGLSGHLRAREVARPPRRAGDPARRDQEGALRLGRLVPRPRQHRPRVLHRPRHVIRRTRTPEGATNAPFAAIDREDPPRRACSNKLGLPDRPRLIAWAWEHGVVAAEHGS